VNIEKLLADLLFAPVIKDKMEHVALSAKAACDGLIIECGVWKGASLSLIADAVRPRIAYGLDSFKGLPAPWTRSPEQTVKEGHFALDEPIRPPRENSKIVVGLIEETLPRLLSEHQEQIGFLHVDVDLGKVTERILGAVTERCCSGTVIRFDEMCDWGGYATRYPEWPNEEFRAFTEWLARVGLEAKAVSRDAWEGATFRIL
jgi:hypothetical protein